MHRYIFTIFCTLFISHLLIAQDDIKPLTKKEKLADFAFLYEELKDTYPYFGVNKRLNKVDWLANKKKYIKQIKATKNNKEYLEKIDQIVNDLNNGHTDFSPTLAYDYYHEAYSHFSKERPEYTPYVTELEKGPAKTNAAYWTKLYKELNDKDEPQANEEKQEEQTKEESSNVELYFDKKQKIATVKIHSFGYEYTEADQDTFVYFYQQLKDYDHLIIDIQGNSGGADDYWVENIAGYLLSDSVKMPVVIGFKNSERIKAMKPHYKANTTFQKLNLPNMPPELKTGDYIFETDYNTVTAHETNYPFAGKIYVLTDGNVYSSTETFAYFCKVTQFATIAGKQTGGDGIGSDPLLLTLPQSGLVMRFTGEMALNADGSSNEEMKTMPDIPLDGKTPQATLEQLKRYIKN